MSQVGKWASGAERSAPPLQMTIPLNIEFMTQVWTIAVRKGSNKGTRSREGVKRSE